MIHPYQCWIRFYTCHTCKTFVTTFKMCTTLMQYYNNIIQIQYTIKVLLLWHMNALTTCMNVLLLGTCALIRTPFTMTCMKDHLLWHLQDPYIMTPMHALILWPPYMPFYYDMNEGPITITQMRAFVVHKLTTCLQRHLWILWHWQRWGMCVLLCPLPYNKHAVTL